MTKRNNKANVRVLNPQDQEGTTNLVNKKPYKNLYKKPTEVERTIQSLRDVTTNLDRELVETQIDITTVGDRVTNYTTHFNSSIETINTKLTTQKTINKVLFVVLAILTIVTIIK